jgi:hypothetical protein
LTIPLLCAAVLPIDAVQRIYGALKPLGYVRQQYYDRSLTPAEFRAKTDTVTRNVRTACHYNQGDAHHTSVKVEVEQYRSDKAARSEWASNRRRRPRPPAPVSCLSGGWS